MPTEKEIKFVQEMVFSISKKKIEKVLAKVDDGGSVKISFGISDEQKIYVSVSPDLDEVQAPVSSDASTEQVAMKFRASTSLLDQGDSGDDEGRVLGCPKPPGCKPPF